MSYDRAITVFSPDGHLMQVEYSMEAVRRGSTVVGIQGKDCVVLAVEKRAVAKLQDSRTARKIHSLDDRTVLAFAGLNADARVLIDRVRVHVQSYRLNMEDAPTIDATARYIANMQQQYTQQGGVRPFGIATLLAGPDEKGRPYLYQTDPAGISARWKAQVVGGRNAKTLREFVEQHFKADAMTEAEAVKLAIQALLEVVDGGATTLQVCVVRTGGAHELLSTDSVQTVVKEIQDAAAEAAGPAEE